MGIIEKDKRVLAPKYLIFVRSLPCVVCDSPKTAPHHVVGHGFSGGALKPDDYLVIPLCNKHHTGDEGVHRGHKSWEFQYGSQLVMCVDTLLMAYVLKAIDQEVAIEYLGMLDSKVGQKCVEDAFNRVIELAYGVRYE